jgi:hypothetical protein
MTFQKADTKFVKDAKESYHRKAQSLSWEQKVASIERMRNASRVARESMREARLGSVVPAGLLRHA